jgi:hypothetical protein
MRAAFEGEQASPARPARAEATNAFLAGPLLAGAALVLLGTAVLVGGGTSDAPLAWIGGGSVLVAAAGFGAVALGRLPAPKLSAAGRLSVLLFAVFVVWNGASVVWSILPDRSWDYTNRGLAYFAFLAVGLLLGAWVRRAPVVLAYGLAAIVAIALAWALAGKIAPSLFPDGARIARLREPVGFWNALALLFALGVPLSLWIASNRRQVAALRAGGVVLLYALVVGVVLTLSRGGAGVAVAAALAWLLLGFSRLESLVAVLLGGSCGLGVAAWALEQPGLVKDGQPYDLRFEDGWHFGLLFGLVGVLLFLLCLLATRWERRHTVSAERRRLLVLHLSVALGALVLGAFGAGVVRAGNPAGWLERQLDEFTSPSEVAQDPTRLGTVSSYRWVWWQEAWEAFEDDPLIGSGAGSFELTHRRLRDNDLTVSEPHSVPLQFLSETGIVGFVLAGGALVAGLVAIASRCRRLTGEERAVTGALALVAVAYLLHSLLEWSWDFVALNAPLFLTVGVLLADGGPSVRRWGRLPALATALLALGLLYSIASPRLAEERVEAAYAALDRASILPPDRKGTALEQALEAAREARALNPVALEPLVAKASAEDLLGLEIYATHTLFDAIRLQPDNPEAWYELGVFELGVTRALNNAFNHLNRAYALDPYGPAGEPLDEVRAIFREQKQKCFAAGTC